MWDFWFDIRCWGMCCGIGGWFGVLIVCVICVVCVDGVVWVLVYWLVVLGEIWCRMVRCRLCSCLW